jgi:hypothetical protein
MALLRWDRGRLGELREELHSVMDQFPGAAFVRAWLSLAEVEADHLDEARYGLRWLVEELPQQPRDGIWMPAMALASVLAVRLNEPEAAAVLYPLLAPYAQHVISFTSPQPVASHGSASLYLGLMATLQAQWAAAGDHFETAIRVHERLEAAPLLARTRYEYARMLLARGRASDRDRALGLLSRALGTASTLGMAAVAEGIRSLQTAQAEEIERPGSMAAEVTGPGLPNNLFRREGEYWTVSYDGSVVRVRDAKGMRYLAQLMAHPGREFHAIDLEAADRQPAPAGARGSTPWSGERELAMRRDLGDAGVLLDATAKAAYRNRVRELRADLEEAESFNDQGRAANLRAELDFLVAELARAVGLSDRDRRAASHAERARLNVTRAIRAAMANLARENPALGRHLAATIRTGRYCSYNPDPRAPITWGR